jgi:HAD superfamily hydrolase (TIGR01509 family)
MLKPRAVLFDIGSTLWSSPAEDPGALDACYSRGRQILLDALGDAPPAQSLVEAVEGYFAEWEEIWRHDASIVTQAPTEDFVATALGRLGVQAPPDALAAFTDAILQVSVGTAVVEPPEPGMPEALAGLRALGLRLGCVSNAFMGAATLHRIMVERRLGEHLEMTISSCEFGYRKPHPSIYEAAVERMGVAAGEVIFVGDRVEQDVVGPAKLGMRTVLSLQYREEDPSLGAIPPDAVIRHLGELPDVAKAMLGASNK